MRVLDIADVSQRDRHSGQVLVHRNPQSGITHCVLIDFGLTTQTLFEDHPNYVGNYAGMLRVLVGSKDRRIPIAEPLIWEHYGEPDEWDPVTMIFSEALTVNGNECKTVQVKDVFPYISFPSQLLL